MPAAAHTQIGPYRIVRLIGEGGMGVVYEAVHESIERRVAIKVLLPEHAGDVEQVTRFFNEARAVNRIEHPSIIQISEFGETDGSPYMVMEFLRGEALSTRLDRLHNTNKRLSVVESLQIAAQVADALTAAHEKSIIHRDLKPGNIMLVRDPVAPGGERAKVLDFGIAKLTQGPKAGRTGIHVVLGTPMYMSPEQCKGAGGVDDKTDVYALGVILYEMLAGEPPFVGVAGVTLMAKHVSQEPPPLRSRAPQVATEVESIVHRLLIKEKEQRPTMKQATDELVTLLSRMSGVNTIPPTPLPILSGPQESEPSLRTTLGHSLGQRLHLTQGPRWLVIACAVALLVMVGVIGRTAHSWWRHGKSATGATLPVGPDGKPLHIGETGKPAPDFEPVKDPDSEVQPGKPHRRHKDSPTKPTKGSPNRDAAHPKKPSSSKPTAPRVQYED